MHRDWFNLEIQSATWGLSPRQSDFVHYMKYEYICPLIFEKKNQTLVCGWLIEEISVAMHIDEKIKIFKDDVTIYLPYQSIYSGERIKEFVPEIYRFV